MKLLRKLGLWIFQLRCKHYYSYSDEYTRFLISADEYFRDRRPALRTLYGANIAFADAFILFSVGWLSYVFDDDVVVEIITKLKAEGQLALDNLHQELTMFAVKYCIAVIMDGGKESKSAEEIRYSLSKTLGMVMGIFVADYNVDHYRERYLFLMKKHSRGANRCDLSKGPWSGYA